MGLVVKKGSNTCETISGAMPFPESLISTTSFGSVFAIFVSLDLRGDSDLVPLRVPLPGWLGRR